MKEVIVIIPSLDPNDKFPIFLKRLKGEMPNIVVVNDGSNDSYNDIFAQIELMNIPVLKHCVNLGKGRALKYAFNYILNEFPECVGVVTADSDGQHSIADIKKCAVALKQNQNDLILGVRNFDNGNVPFKSEYGNKITRTFFKFFVGLKITDTQTGLRAIGKEQMKQFLATAGERFEYETNMLIDTKKLNINITEVPIETIYIENNSSSHFNPIKDSARIYKLFVKYIFASISSFVVDIVLFSLILSLIHVHLGNYAILTATVIARIISSIYNYLINSKLVFQKQKTISTFIKYYILVLIQMMVSGISVSLIVNYWNLGSATVWKILVDIVIFLVNFYIQREWVFKMDRKGK